MKSALIDDESLRLEDHLRLIKESIDVELEDHADECAGAARCLICRTRADDETVNRIAIARLEYAQKVLPLDRNGRGGLCVYCGGISDQRDHLLPRGWTGEAIRRLVPTVPACAHCNRTINDHPSPLIAERSSHVASRIRLREGMNLSRSEKTDEELEEYGHRLRTMLRAKRFQRQVLRARLIVLDLGGLPEVPEEWRALLAEGEYVKIVSEAS